MDPSVTESFLGWVSAIFGIGQTISAFGFGYWTEKRPSIEPMTFSLVFLFIGSVLYSYAQAFGKKGIYVVLVARLILGISAGAFTLR